MSRDFCLIEALVHQNEPPEPLFEPAEAVPAAPGVLRIRPASGELLRRVNSYEPAEDAYRRGFAQAAAAATYAATAGASADLLQQWRKSVNHWRHNRTNLRTLSPPAIVDASPPGRGKEV
jgi:hypothetical protein